MLQRPVEGHMPQTDLTGLAARFVVQLSRPQHEQRLYQKLCRTDADYLQAPSWHCRLRHAEPAIAC